MLGSGFEVQSPATRGQGFESLVRIYRFMLHFSSAFALIVGMFLIYNAFAIAVTQRRGEIGLLRALGATRGQVWRLFLTRERRARDRRLRARRLRRSGGRGRGGARHGAAAARRVRSCRFGGVPITRSPGVAAIAVAIGVVTSALAAALPARNAARIDPIKALQKGRRQVLGAGSSRGRTHRRGGAGRRRRRAPRA